MKYLAGKWNIKIIKNRKIIKKGYRWKIQLDNLWMQKKSISSQMLKKKLLFLKIV